MENKCYSINIESLIRKKLDSISNLLNRCDDIKSINHGLKLIKFSIDSIKSGFDEKNEEYIKFKEALKNSDIKNYDCLSEFYESLSSKFTAFTYDKERIAEIISSSTKASTIENEILDILNSMRVNEDDRSKELINKVIDILSSTDINRLDSKYSELLGVSKLTCKNPDLFIINSDLLFPGLINSYIGKNKESRLSKYISGNRYAFEVLNNLPEDIKEILGIKYHEGKHPIISIEWI